MHVLFKHYYNFQFTAHLLTSSSLSSVPSADKLNLHADYYHHLRKIWSNTAIKAINSHYRQELSKELKDVYAWLRFKVNLPKKMSWPEQLI